MTSRWMVTALAMLALAGCQLVFPLDGHTDRCKYFSADADEDMDDVPDADDNCPNLQNNDQKDTDGDGVGDACDPRPDVADQLECFYPFNDKAELAELDQPFSADWEITAGAAFQPIPKDRDGLALVGEFTSPSIIVIARNLSDPAFLVEPALGAITAGVDITMTPFPTAGVVCEVKHRNADTVATLVEIDPFDVSPVTPIDATSSTIGLAVTPTGFDGKPRCDANQGGATTKLVLDGVAPATGQVAVYVDHGAVQIDSILVIVPQ